jgi:hypothetical protein
LATPSRQNPQRYPQKVGATFAEFKPLDLSDRGDFPYSGRIELDFKIDIEKCTRCAALLIKTADTYPKGAMIVGTFISTLVAFCLCLAKR